MAVLRLLTGPKTIAEPIRLPASDVDLHLDQPWREPLTQPRITRDAIGSVLFHLIVVVMWITLPEAPFAARPPRPINVDISKSIPLYLPKDFELTQRDPNNGRITHTLDVRSMVSAPVPQAPRLKAPTPPPGPVAKAPEPVKLAAIDPPKIDPPKIELPKMEQPVISAAPPKPPPAAAPAPPPPEKPKIAFEDIGSTQHVAPNPNRGVPLPKQLADQQRQPTFGGGGTIVGDVGDSPVTTQNAQHAPSQGETRSNLQLLSDPKGVDFKPYMIQVLTAVRRNWLAILPDTARNGRRGRVIVQFAIDRSGGVPKVVIAEGAGTDAFDRAAVAAISASVPLPPLPKDFTGDRISLQFAFSYNMPSR